MQIFIFVVVLSVSSVQFLSCQFSVVPCHRPCIYELQVKLDNGMCNGLWKDSDP